MDIHHLRYFVALSEELHFGRAARRLHMAQPPLSQRIKSLESELGMPLFLRTRSGVELTEAGALLLEFAQPVLDRFEDAQEAMRRIRPGVVGKVEAAFPPDTNPVTITETIRAFTRRQPEVLLNLHELTTQEQIVLLRDGELDVAVVRHPISTVGLASGPVHTSELGIVLPSGHRLAQNERVDLSQLGGEPLIIFPRAMAPDLYDEVLKKCRDVGYLPSAIRHARNHYFVHGLVAAGRGIHFNERPWSPLAPG